MWVGTLPDRPWTFYVDILCGHFCHAMSRSVTLSENHMRGLPWPPGRCGNSQNRRYAVRGSDWRWSELLRRHIHEGPGQIEICHACHAAIFSCHAPKNGQASRAASGFQSRLWRPEPRTLREFPLAGFEPGTIGLRSIRVTTELKRQPH